MKKALFTFLLLFAATAMNAQTIVKGDMNDDKELTITDAVSVVDVILGNAPKQTIGIGGDPYMVDNTLVVGTWKSSGGESFTLNEDGSTNLPEFATYKFRPYQGTLMFFDSQGKARKTIVLGEVEKGRYLLAANYNTDTYIYYYRDESGSIGGRDYVDLGLPSGTLWATCNVGASSPEDYGNYIAWGEMSSKSTYDFSTYKWCNGSKTTLTKYCTWSSFGNNGFTDNKTELDPDDDAAYVNWGRDWRMPSQEQFEELINSSYTTTEWTTQNGVNGCLITSKSNGNSIFLPAAGDRYYSYLGMAGSSGDYWSRTLLESYPSCAWGLFFNSGDNIYTSSNWDRYYGYSVRPVRFSEISVEVSSSSLSFASLGGSKQVSINCNGSWTASSSESWCAVSPASGTGDGSLTITVSENTSTDSRSATVTVTADALTRTITVTQDGKAIDNTPAGVTAVNLGLPSGTLWANMNVGASSPEDYGDYFAWGETSTKTTYNWSTYFDTNDNGSTFNKYNNGGLTELKPEDDAAYVNWGPTWRMPSQEQFDELINSSYTTTEWITTESGVSGRKITSKMEGYKGNFVFLPAAGYRGDSSLFNAGSYGNFWSRTPIESGPYHAWYLYFNSSGIGTSYDGRYNGMSVRPVRFSE